MIGFVIGAFYGFMLGFMLGWVVGWKAGYNLSRSETDRVRMVQELCPMCDGYGYHIDTDLMPKLKKDKCEFCDGNGYLRRHIEVPRATWGSMWNKFKKRSI